MAAHPRRSQQPGHYHHTKVVRNSGGLSCGTSWLLGCFATGDGCSRIHQVHNTHISLNFIVSHLQNKGGTTQKTLNSTIGVRSGSFTYEVSKTAVHLELVNDYSTDGFLAAYKRFISRRGRPYRLYSDCGTNFIGAAKELRTLFRQAQLENSTMYNSIVNEGTQWIFHLLHHTCETNGKPW